MNPRPALLAGTLLLAGCSNDTEAYRLKALEKRVDDLEVSKLVNRPFMRDVSRAEGNAVGHFTDEVVEIQKSGFLLTGCRFGSHNIAFDFTRGQETLTRTIRFNEPLP
jgi:hypothetical protein